MEELKQEIKLLIMEVLGITDVEPDEVGNDDALFAEGNVMGLDSIDALEIVMARRRSVDDKNQSRFILKSITTISEFISKNRKN